MRKHDHIENAMVQTGNPTAAEPETGDAAIPQTIFLTRCSLPDQDRVLCLRIIKQLHDDLALNKSSDIMQAEMVAIYSLKLMRAQDSGNTEAAEIYDRMIRAHLKDLRASKKARQGAASASRPHLPVTELT